MGAFADLDLTFTQVRVMMLLAYVNQSLRISSVAARLNLTFASAGRNVDRLLHEDLVERNEDPQDRRVKLVRLTPRGQVLVSEYFAFHRQAIVDFSHRLSPADRIRLANALIPVLASDVLFRPPAGIEVGADIISADNENSGR